MVLFSLHTNPLSFTTFSTLERKTPEVTCSRKSLFDLCVGKFVCVNILSFVVGCF